MKNLQTTRWGHWPSGKGRPVAMVPFDLEQLSARYGLHYEHGVDDLDEYSLAAITLANGRQAWFYKHASDPVPGTLAYVDSEDGVPDSQRLLADALGIPVNEMAWLAPVPEAASPASTPVLAAVR